MSAACRGCGKPIFFAYSERGHRCPMDVAPDPKGTYVLRDERGRRAGTGDEDVYMVKASDEQRDGTLDPKEPRYTSHFATCPDARRFRKPEHKGGMKP